MAVVLHVAEKGLAVAGDGGDIAADPLEAVGPGLHAAVVHRFVGLHRRHAAVVGVGVDQLARDHLIEGLLAEVPGGSHRQQEGLPLQPPVGAVVVVHRAVGVSGARAVLGVDPRQTAAVVFEYGAAERRAVVHRAADFPEQVALPGEVVGEVVEGAHAVDDAADFLGGPTVGGAAGSGFLIVLAAGHSGQHEGARGEDGEDFVDDVCHCFILF